MKNFKTLFNRIEGILIKVCFISILALIGLQFLISSEDVATFFRSPLDYNSMFQQEREESESGIIELLIDDKKDKKNVEILINGEVVGSFKSNNIIQLEVYHNDLIEVNGSQCRESVKVKVVGISRNITSPKLNTIVLISQSIEIMGKVIIK